MRDTSAIYFEKCAFLFLLIAMLKAVISYALVIQKAKTKCYFASKVNKNLCNQLLLFSIAAVCSSAIYTTT